MRRLDLPKKHWIPKEVQKYLHPKLGLAKGFFLGKLPIRPRKSRSRNLKILKKTFVDKFLG